MSADVLVWLCIFDNSSRHDLGEDLDLPPWMTEEMSPQTSLDHPAWLTLNSSIQKVLLVFTFVTQSSPIRL